MTRGGTGMCSAWWKTHWMCWPWSAPAVFEVCTTCYNGVISPLDGIGPEQLKLKELFARLSGDYVKELVIATNPTLEGEATAMYIRRQLAGSELKITHLARGLPVGGALEYTDELTLTRAFQGRQEL